MNPLTRFKNITILPLCIPLTFACFGLLPTARAVVPPPDGDYPGGNTAEGQSALFSLTTGSNNTAIGYQALFSNTGGFQNTATGSQALLSNTVGRRNTATGFKALFFNTANFNTANGDSALRSNTTGVNNTATGVNALFHNTIGHDNTANGVQALFSNTIGSVNTATGVDALFHNTEGQQNTATGFRALFNNTTGIQNTADGQDAIFRNTTGRRNTAIGNTALVNNTIGSENVALGFFAGVNLTTGDNNIHIGNRGVADEANTIRIGTVETQVATFVAGISGKTAAGGIPVIVNANGKLGTTASSARYKEAIKPMEKASEAILALKPVTFRYKQELDPEGIPQFGLVAEEVAKVNPDLVVRDDSGEIYTVRYEAVNAMLLNEFLKQHKAFIDGQHNVEKLQATVVRQQKQIEALTAGLQKVSAQQEASKSVPHVVDSNY